MPGPEIAYNEVPRSDTGLGPRADPPPPQGFRRLFYALLPLIPILIILAALLCLCLVGIGFSRTKNDYGCDPDGNVWVTQAHRPNVWAGDYGLAITLGWGQFTITQAKATDIAWDLIVAHGLQFFMVYVVYYVFRGPISHSMEYYGVEYETVLKLQYNTVSSASLLQYVKNMFWSRRSFKHMIGALFLVIATACVLLIPTIVGAMAGYQAIMLPVYDLQNGTFVNFSQLDQCEYVIQDGNRIGLNSDACIEAGSAISGIVASYIFEYINFEYSDGWTADANPAASADIASSIAIPNDQSYALSPPVLNITYNNFRDPPHSVYFNGQTLTATQMEKVGKCLPQNVYKWGFSLVLLFMFLSCSSLFSLLLYAIWVRSYWFDTSLSKSTRLARSTQVFGSLKAAMAVTASIEEELGALAATEMSNDRLKHVLKRRGAGLRAKKINETVLLRVQSEASLPKTFDRGDPSRSRDSSRHGRSASTRSFV